MLVLSRHRDERIMIGEDVTVTVLEIRGDKVRLGFEAPYEVPIDREEVRLRIEGKKIHPNEKKIHHGVTAGTEEGSEAGASEAAQEMRLCRAKLQQRLWNCLGK